MRRADFVLLVTTALCWGSSFLFIKVAIEDVAPVVLMVLRCTIGAVPLWATAAFLRRRRGERLGAGMREALRTRPWALLVLGVLTGLPLWLIGLGEQHIDSGLAGVVNASVPLWATLLAIRFDPLHLTGPRRIVGVGVGFAGVLLLGVARGSIGGGSEAVGIAAVAAAGLMYAFTAVLVRERLSAIPSVESAAWSVTIGAAAFIPVALADLPTRAPTTATVASIAALGLFGTFLGFLCYYELIARVGAARATMVTYLLPPLAISYGWLLLDEAIGIETIAATGVILVGVWLGSRREVSEPATAPGP